MICKFCEGKYCRNLPIPEDQYENSKRFLAKLERNVKVHRHTSTYSVKHIAEKWTRRNVPGQESAYICGCSLAQAAEDMGFILERINAKSPNWLMNINRRSLRQIVINEVREPQTL